MPDWVWIITVVAALAVLAVALWAVAAGVAASVCRVDSGPSTTAPSQSAGAGAKPKLSFPARREARVSTSFR